jgi:DNA-binding response OmpR family regulator
MGGLYGKKKILIVDDDPMIRYTLNEALRGWEYDTVEAGTVAGALASFEAERPAAVLLDINLPDGSGLDGLREIKKLRPQAVVIMITAYVLLEDTIAVLRGGAPELGEIGVSLYLPGGNLTRNRPSFPLRTVR